MPHPEPRPRESLFRKFRDFDDLDEYQRVLRACHDLGSSNFVVQFGAKHARTATDLDASEIKAFLALPSTDDYPIRWINFWNTTKQKDAIGCVGEHFGFTGRLRASITNWDRYKPMLKARPPKEKRLPDPFSKEAAATEKDLEQGPPGGTSEDSLHPLNPAETMYFRLVQSSMNYTSIDQGQRFTCIGANWLHNRPDLGLDMDPSAPLVPPRHWAWLVLGMSGDRTDTVISIHEAPNFETPPRSMPEKDRDEWRARELRSMRQNTVRVLTQLSRIGIDQHKDSAALSLKAIREPLWLVQQQQPAPGSRRSSTYVAEGRVAEVGASNLFYYLFEDDLAAGAVLLRSEMRLRDLTKRVLRSSHLKENKTADTKIIPELHKFGQDLRLMQHLFESYKILVQTILDPDSGDAETVERVKIEQQARDRFRRLRSRLQLILLDKIKECLDEKTELSSTFFNLTAQKDSEATARLTRSATVLAKLSVLFLPVSFMTSYFSVAIPDMLSSYTSRTYWGAFGVVLGISIVCLFFFSRVLMAVTERLENVSEPIERWVAQTICVGRRRRKEKLEGEEEGE
ncbi:hypothetical protein VTK73DRAFT_4421 [Phialemonium thermophilum]|uniref:ADP-ribosylation factor n=1 Tax=Phialemonium thermophilum TaxID=223376 RepID=A0ABR3WU34_9PEZI